MEINNTFFGPNFELRFNRILEKNNIRVSENMKLRDVESELQMQALDNQEIDVAMTKITRELFFTGVQFLADTAEGGSDIRNIVEFLSRGISPRVSGDFYDSRVYGMFGTLVFAKSLPRSVEYIANSLAVNVDEFTERLNAHIYLAGEKIGLESVDADWGTVSFLQGEEIVTSNQNDPVIGRNQVIAEVACLIIPVDFIERVFENPLEALADIVEAGSIFRDHIAGRLSEKTSVKRASMYRAEFLNSFPTGTGGYSLSVRSEYLLDDYTVMQMERQDDIEKLFYWKDVTSVGLVSQSNLVNNRTPITLN